MIDELAELLAGQKTPEQIVSFRLSPELENRIDDLLAREKETELTREESAELDRYMEALAKADLLKAHALEALEERRRAS